MQNAANSSSVPSLRIGTCASTLARDSASVTPFAREELGEVHEVGAHDVDLHAGACHLGRDVPGEHRRARARGGVERRTRRGPGSRRARDQQDLTVALFDEHRHDRGRK